MGAARLVSRAADGRCGFTPMTGPRERRRKFLRLTITGAVLTAVIVVVVARRDRQPTPPVAAAVDAKANASKRTEVGAGDSVARPGVSVATLRLPSSLQVDGVVTLGDALRALAAMPDDAARTAYYQALLRIGVAADPAGTAELAAALDDPKLRELGVGFVLLLWAKADAPAALRWAVEHPRAENDATRFFAAFEGFADHDPLGAMRWLQRPEFSGDADELSRIAIFHAHSAGRLAEARAEIEKMGEGNARDLLVRQTVRVWAAEAPVDAANWLASTASDATFRAGIGALVQTLVERDPTFAAGLTQQFADPQIRGQFLADVVYVWARRDLGAAAAWLRAQPAGTHLDAANARMAEATAKFDPVEATAWVNAVRDAVKREELRQRLKRGG
jgi:hypothetical protein